MTRTTDPIRARCATILIVAATLSAERAARADEPVADPPPKPFRVDPIVDIALIGVSAGFAGLSQLTLSTGEIRPQRPGSPQRLLSIDRGAVSQTVDPNADAVSNVGVAVAFGFALLDPVLSGFREDRSAALIDATLYAETLSLTLSIAGLTKIAVRRPRPRAYVEQAKLDAEYGADQAPAISDTDSSLSFYSGHAAVVASIGATATYLAFTRSNGGWRPWVTLAASALLTAGVSIERVRAGAHFPTDVIAGSIAGAGIGVLVPHMHRADSAERRVWFGAAPSSGGGSVTLQGIF